jgi:SAM-dependent methyltransferase
VDNREEDNMLRIDLGCGNNKKEGFIGIDNRKLPEVDLVCDLETQPLPLEDNSVDELYCAHVMEHFSRERMYQLMEEIWRICKKGAKITIKVPHFSSYGAFHEEHLTFFRYNSFQLIIDDNDLGFPKIRNDKYNPMQDKFHIVKRRFHMQHPWQFMNLFIHWMPHIYEKQCIRNLFPCYEIMFELEVIK